MLFYYSSSYSIRVVVVAVITLAFHKIEMGVFSFILHCAFLSKYTW